MRRRSSRCWTRAKVVCAADSLHTPCVRIEADGRVLVIDPGVWCETEAPTCSWSESSPFRRSRSQVSGWSTRRPTQPVYGDEPSCANLGYVVEGTLYHPGDALDVPEEDVETLLVPIQGAWVK